jgi:SAM-dependent methyltransferase
MSKDLFSTQAKLYAKYRPNYPPELIHYILDFVEVKNAAWDCATGNGQAAGLLSPFFRKIEATDISEKQLQQATSYNNVFYSVSTAESTSFPDNSFDLIAVAQAYHWFNFTRFHAEATRVAKPGAVIAAWGYSLLQSDNEQLDDLIKYFYVDVTGEYWDNERKYVDLHYETVTFDFDPLPSKDFFIEVKWNRDDLLGYFNTWSSVQNFIKATGNSPIHELKKRLYDICKDPYVLYDFSFPVFLRIGRIAK